MHFYTLGKVFIGVIIKESGVYIFAKIQQAGPDCLYQNAISEQLYGEMVEEFSKY